jgi:hypothetical protein
MPIASFKAFEENGAEDGEQHECNRHLTLHPWRRQRVLREVGCGIGRRKRHRNHEIGGRKSHQNQRECLAA